jgi:TolB-like protein
MKRMRVFAVVLFVIAFSSFLTAQERTREDQGREEKPRLRVCVATQFPVPRVAAELSDSVTGVSRAQGARRIFDKYFGEGRSELLASAVNGQIVRSLAFGLDELHWSALIGDDSAVCFYRRDDVKSFKLRNSISIDDEGTLFLHVTVATWGEDSLAIGLVQGKLLKARALADPSRWSKLEQASGPDFDDDTKAILDRIAESLVYRVGDAVLRWFVETNLRLRAIVFPFKQLDHDPNRDFLSTGLKRMVETELVRSQDIVIYDVDDSANVNIDSIGPHYSIKGDYFFVDGGLRIDMRCVKSASRRTLAGDKVTVNPVEIDELSRRITIASNSLKNAMISDFRTSFKEVAVAAGPQIQYFHSGRSRRAAIEVARMIAQGISSKLSLMLADIQESEHEVNLKIRDVDYRAGYFRDTLSSPAEIISDLDVDYLVLIRTGDFGQRMSLTTTLHSFDLDRPAVAEHIDYREFYKSDTEQALNQAALKIARRFCDLGILTASDFCALCREEHPRQIIRTLDKASVTEIRKKRSLSFGAGTAAHSSPAIYLGKESSEYFELTFSHLLPHPFWLPAQIGNQVELVFGYDFGNGNILRQGIISAGGFVNYALFFDRWQHSMFPMVLSVGAGFGGSGISYHLSPGKLGYAEETNFRNGVIKPAADAFARIDFSVSDLFSLQVTLRRVFLSPEITSFADIQFDPELPATPSGSLNAWCFLGGLKYVWR